MFLARFLKELPDTAVLAGRAFVEAAQAKGGLAVLMCAEGDPAKCHRHPLLARELLVRGCVVQHVLRDGNLRDASTMFRLPVNPQLPLMIGTGEDDSWESPKKIR